MRTLICTAPPRTIALSGTPVPCVLPAGESYEIIEGLYGITPINRQSSEVSEGTAEELVRLYPDLWRIVDQAEVEVVVGRLAVFTGDSIPTL